MTETDKQESQDSVNPELISSLSNIIINNITPSLDTTFKKLGELQDQQCFLLETIVAKRQELRGEETKYREAQQVLEQIPHYINLVQNIKKKMAQTTQMIETVSNDARVLNSKLEQRDKEREARKMADAAGYNSVSAS